MWIKPNRDKDIWVAPRKLLAAKKDVPVLVRREIGAKEVTSGDAVEVEAPNRAEKEGAE